MGASESTISASQRSDDEITTISERLDGADPVLEKLRSLKITTPIIKSPPVESSLTDILVRKPSSNAPGTVNPKILFELFSMYRDWQEDKAQKISKKQEEIENNIELVDALSVKLLQRFNYSVSTMKTTSQHLSEGQGTIYVAVQLFLNGKRYKFLLMTVQLLLTVEIGELKGRLTEVISNCDALCKRVASEGPESLRSSITPFAANLEIRHGSSSVQRVSDEGSPSSAPKED